MGGRCLAAQSRSRAGLGDARTEFGARGNISRMMYDVNATASKKANIGSYLTLEADRVARVAPADQPCLGDMREHGVGGSRRILGGDALIDPPMTAVGRHA